MRLVDDKPGQQVPLVEVLQCRLQFATSTDLPKEKTSLIIKPIFHCNANHSLWAVALV